MELIMICKSHAWLICGPSIQRTQSLERMLGKFFAKKKIEVSGWYSFIFPCNTLVPQVCLIELHNVITIF